MTIHKEQVMRYDEYVKVLVDQKSSLLLNHETVDESATIIMEMFKHSKGEIKIYDYSLSNNTIGKLSSHGLLDNPFSHVYEFLNNGKKLKILLDNGNYTFSEAYYALMQYDSLFPKQIEIKATDQLPKEFNRYFAVNDNHAFRIELELRKNADEITKAAASFNDDVNAKKLNDAFDTRYRNADRHYELKYSL